jgi:hypothetical protein
MAGIIEFPQVVEDALREFGDLFPNEPQRRHFAEYLTGLYVARHKTVNGINGEFAQTTDQSCLNRFMTEAVWDADELNRRRLDLMQQAPDTRYSPHGVLPIDNTLIDHEGKLIPDAAWFWDHAEERYKIAQDYLFLNYVCPSGKHYPLLFRRFVAEAQCQADGRTFVNHTQLCIELIDWACAQQIPGDFTFDNYFTNAEILNHVHGRTDSDGRPRGYVGDLKFNRKVQWRGRVIHAVDLGRGIAADIRKPVQVGERKQWYFTTTVHIPGVRHKVRIVVLYKRRQDAEPCKILVTNRITWEVNRIVGVYRYRWTGTETFHRDGKQQLGLGDCQLRDDQGQTRHMHLVLLAYSLLMRQLRQSHAWEWAYCQLTTIGEACRAMLRETLRKTLTWAMEHVMQQGWGVPEVIDRLNLGPVPCSL